MGIVKLLGIGSDTGIPLGGLRCTFRVFGPVCSTVPVMDTSKPAMLRLTFTLFPPVNVIERPEPPPPNAEATLENGITPVPVTWPIVPL